MINNNNYYYIHNYNYYYDYNYTCTCLVSFMKVRRTDNKQHFRLKRYVYTFCNNITNWKKHNISVLLVESMNMWCSGICNSVHG